MIIIEGPDNSGKSTLIKKLKKELRVKLYRRKPGPPKDSNELLNRTHWVMMSHNRQDLIIDRHPLIGEPIYGPLLRNHNMWDENPDFFSLYSYILKRQLDENKVFLIYCRPPEKKILDLQTHQVKDYDTPKHLKALKKQAKKVVNKYDEIVKPIANYIYDYTQDPDSYKQLINKIKELYL